MNRLLLLLLVAACWMPAPSLAWDNLDIQAELRRPGVRLVAVEFYADWCTPCKKAVPKWNRLHQKYKDRGLRLVVVSVSSAGGCVNPGWMPDRVVCDMEGRIQDAFGADPLPQAYLYSWQGNQLVAHAHYGQVERAVKNYFKRLPRILIDDPVDHNGKSFRDAKALKEAVRGKLADLSKFDLVASQKEMAELRKLRKKSSKANYDETQTCALGKEVSANSILKVILLTMGGQQTLVLQLFSAESGCIIARTEARVSSGDLSSASFEAALALVDSLVGGVKQSDGPPVHRGELSGSGTVVEYVPPSGEDVVFSLASVPAGAKVKAKGITLCPSTPCEGLEITAGTHLFEFSKDRYAAERKRVNVKRGMKPISATLNPMFGWLTVTTEPVGVPVTLDGRQVGSTPLSPIEVDPGRHKVQVGNEVLVQQWREFDLAQGQTKEYSFQLVARQGGLKVKARDRDNRALEGTVFLDGQEAGVTGRAFTSRIGRHIVEVRTETGIGKSSVEVQESETIQVVVKVETTAALYGATRKSEIQWVYSRPSRLQFAKTETTVAQYAACVRAGECEIENHKGSTDYTYCNWGYLDRSEHPMNCVNWYGADQFCKWAGGRLPSEGEWYAEASSDGSQNYPWGYYVADCNRCVMNNGVGGCGKDRTWPVCSKRAGNSVSGLCDMAGNVWEWTATSLEDRQNHRALRGGSWTLKYPADLRTSVRKGSSPGLWDDQNGFRCVKPRR